MDDCKTCSVLKESLEFERARNKELLETLTALLKPAPIQQVTNNTQVTARPVGLTFSRRRAELEKADRLRTEALSSPHAAKPNTSNTETIPELSELIKETEGQKTVEQLEAELGVTIADSEETE